MKTKRITAIVLCMVLCVIMGGENLLSALFILTSAAESEEDIKYTNAYNDLISDKNFNPDDYPVLNKSDSKYYSLEVITIAESVNGELFVYVYQPSANSDIRASHITIALSERNVNDTAPELNRFGKFEVYSLTYINNYNQFFKYKVDGLKVSDEYIRSYEITDILRPYNKNFGDKEPGAGNTVSAVSYPVGRIYTFSGSSENSTLSLEEVEYITITDKHVGYIRFQQDMPLLAFMSSSSVDAHFVAFSTDKPIDKLLEADVYYTFQSYYYDNENWSSNSDEEAWGEKEVRYSYLDYKDQAIYEVSDGSMLSSSSLIVDRIQKTSEFLKLDVPIFAFPGFSVKGNLQFSEEELKALENTDWVLCFTETSHANTTVGNNTINRFARVGDVKILRLKFITDGKIYDLGVVDNMQTGSLNPSATVMEQDWYQILVALLLTVIVLMIGYIALDIYVPWAAKIIRWVVGAFWWLFTSLLKLVWWFISTLFNIITAPFRSFFDNASRKVKKTLNIKSPRRSRGNGRKSRSSRNSRFWQKTVEDLTSSVKTSIEKGKEALRAKAKRK